MEATLRGPSKGSDLQKTPSSSYEANYGASRLGETVVLSYEQPRAGLKRTQGHLGHEDDEDEDEEVRNDEEEAGGKRCR